MAHQRIDRAIDVGSPRNYDAHEALDNLLARNADPGQIARFFADLTGQGTTAMSVLRSLRTGAMAGGLNTEAKVAASPFIQTALRAPAGAVNLLLQGRAGEIPTGLRGGMAGLVEGTRDALETVKYGINYRAALSGGAPRLVVVVALEQPPRVQIEADSHEDELRLALNLGRRKLLHEIGVALLNALDEIEAA